MYCRVSTYSDSAEAVVLFPITSRSCRNPRFLIALKVFSHSSFSSRGLCIGGGRPTAQEWSVRTSVFEPRFLPHVVDDSCRVVKHVNHIETSLLAEEPVYKVKTLIILRGNTTNLGLAMSVG